MRKFSVIVPVFNRPVEVSELLASLTQQTYRNFEVIVVEDGSSERCESICEQYADRLNIRYFYKENSGQGFSRNFGFAKAEGDYFVQFDSDALIPADYFTIVNKQLDIHQYDAYGGPDTSAPGFTPIQKAINYAMTSIFTTGGIRGQKKNLGGQFHPRSFNFGLSRTVFKQVGGYKLTRMGEDIEFSIRIIQHGFKVGLIPEAYIFHKRRTSLTQFFKQLHFFGRARVNISRFFPEELKLVHYFPLLFTSFVCSIPALYLVNTSLGTLALIFLLVYLLLIFTASTYQNKSLQVGILSIFACFTQLFGYGIGFLSELFKKNK